MICDEIHDILNDPQDDGTGLDIIADQFRDERDVMEILELLNSSDSELISIGAWFLGEVDFEKYNNEEIIYRLVKLCSHENVHVRLSVSGALYPVFEVDKQLARTILEKLLHDSNEGVRMGAQAAAKRLSLLIE